MLNGNQNNTLPNIYFDESGNTGQDLINLEQPVYVLTSVKFNDIESLELIDLNGRKVLKVIT